MEVLFSKLAVKSGLAWIIFDIHLDELIVVDSVFLL